VHLLGAVAKRSWLRRRRRQHPVGLLIWCVIGPWRRCSLGEPFLTPYCTQPGTSMHTCHTSPHISSRFVWSGLGRQHHHVVLPVSVLRQDESYKATNQQRAANCDSYSYVLPTHGPGWTTSWHRRLLNTLTRRHPSTVARCV
jgi:hypothetical protein